MAGLLETHAVGSEPYVGHYINLDRSVERREQLERQFAKFGLQSHYRRFPATDGQSLVPRSGVTPGERGCFHSHMSILQQSIFATKPIHILEDDAVLSEHVAPAIGLIARVGVLGSFDLVFTDMFVPPDVRAIKQMKALYDKALAASASGFDPANIQVIDLAAVNFSAASSYVVNPKSVGRMLQLYKQEWEAGPTIPYDIFLRREVHRGRLRAACLLPFVTSINLEEIGRSTIGRRGGAARGGETMQATTEQRSSGASPLVMSIIRYSFFVNRDLENYAGPMLSAVLADTIDKDKDSQRDLIAGALRFVLSDRYRQF